MKKVLLILFLFLSFNTYSQLLPSFRAVFKAPSISIGAGIVAQFGLSSTSYSVPGWIIIVGNPDLAVLTGSDNRSGSTITISSVNSTDVAYWNPLGSNSGYQPLSGSGHVLPTELYRGYWFQNTSPYTPGKEQIQIGGLNPSKTYTIRILCSRQGTPSGISTRVYCVDNLSTTAAPVVSPGNYNGDFNVIFTGKIPKSSGILSFAIEPGGIGSLAHINAIQIEQL